jgi:hypothetical protein
MDTTGKGELTVADQLVYIDEQEESHSQRREAIQRMWSKKFQWLPCEVKLRGDSGTDVEITSCINNLLPVKYQHLYGVVEKFIAKSIPLWNEVLIKDEARNSVRIRTYGAQYEPSSYPEWAGEEGIYSGELSSETLAKFKEYMALPNNPDYRHLSWASNPPDDWSPETVRNRSETRYDWRSIGFWSGNTAASERSFTLSLVSLTLTTSGKRTIRVPLLYLRDQMAEC